MIYFLLLIRCNFGNYKDEEWNKMIASYILYSQAINIFCGVNMDSQWNRHIGNEYVYKKSENLNGQKSLISIDKMKLSYATGFVVGNQSLDDDLIQPYSKGFADATPAREIPTFVNSFIESSIERSNLEDDMDNPTLYNAEFNLMKLFKLREFVNNLDVKNKEELKIKIEGFIQQYHRSKFMMKLEALKQQSPEFINEFSKFILNLLGEAWEVLFSTLNEDDVAFEEEDLSDNIDLGNISNQQIFLVTRTGPERRYENWFNVMFQYMPEDVQEGRMPRHFMALVLVHDDKQIKPGDRICLTTYLNNPCHAYVKDLQLILYTLLSIIPNNDFIALLKMYKQKFSENDSIFINDFIDKWLGPLGNPVVKLPETSCLLNMILNYDDGFKRLYKLFALLEDVNDKEFKQEFSQEFNQEFNQDFIKCCNAYMLLRSEDKYPIIFSKDLKKMSEDDKINKIKNTVISEILYVIEGNPFQENSFIVTTLGKKYRFDKKEIYKELYVVFDYEILTDVGRKGRPALTGRVDRNDQGKLELYTGIYGFTEDVNERVKMMYKLIDRDYGSTSVYRFISSLTDTEFYEMLQVALADCELTDEDEAFGRLQFLTCSYLLISFIAFSENSHISYFGILFSIRYLSINPVKYHLEKNKEVTQTILNNISSLNKEDLGIIIIETLNTINSDFDNKILVHLINELIIMAINEANDGVKKDKRNTSISSDNDILRSFLLQIFTQSLAQIKRIIVPREIVRDTIMIHSKI